MFHFEVCRKLKAFTTSITVDTLIIWTLIRSIHYSDLFRLFTPSWNWSIGSNFSPRKILFVTKNSVCYTHFPHFLLIDINFTNEGPFISLNGQPFDVELTMTSL